MMGKTRRPSQMISILVGALMRIKLSNLKKKRKKKSKNKSRMQMSKKK